MPNDVPEMSDEVPEVRKEMEDVLNDVAEIPGDVQQVPNDVADAPNDVRHIPDAALVICSLRRQRPRLHLVLHPEDELSIRDAVLTASPHMSY